MNECGNVTVTL